MHAAARFTSHDWIGAVDVPTAVLVTTRDNVVPAIRQRRLAAAIPGAVVHEVDGGHGACVSRPESFAAALLKACLSLGLTGASAAGESA
jgi:3-oxoadipate enol-lactonase